MSTCLASLANSGRRSFSTRKNSQRCGKVSGEEQYDQDLDELNRLEAEEVHLGIAHAGTCAEKDQRQR